MQRNRLGENPAASSTIITTRSRSASSSGTSNTGTSSSDSSSSGSSSSSSSSGSDSDSSSSGTEASRASASSRQSRASRASRNSRTSRSSQKSASATPKKAPSLAINSSKGAASKKPPGPQSPSITSNATTLASSKNRILSGSLSGILNKAKPAPKPARRKSVIASSSESESQIEEPVIKKVGSKPPSTSISLKKPPTAASVKSALKRKQQQAANNAAKANKAAGKKPPANTNSPKPSVSSTSRKLMKSIFSPEHSSEGTDTDSKPKVQKVKAKPPSVKVNGAASKFAKANAVRKKKVVGEDKKRKAANATPVKAATSSASSASASSSASSSSSSSGSSSDSEKKNEEEVANNESETNKNDDDSLSSSSRKRPVTRRQRGAVKSKTIPTTTSFNQSALTKPQSQVAALWDSDGMSDEPKTLTRAPSKTNQKSRRLLTEEDEELLEREKKCPFPGCDSMGHLSGKFSTHYMLTTCPNYHGLSPEECKENADERTKREIERKKYFFPHQPHHKKQVKLSQEAKNWVAKAKELRTRDANEGICSEYDLSLWNDALAVAAHRIESEQGEGLGHRSVAMGRWEMSCWCASPYPEPLCRCRRLFICEFCLKPVQSGTVLRRHCAKCVWRHPPGDEIYRKDRLSVWEVDGKSQKTYCQNLCLLAKCFLDHKTLYVDVDPFLFYVMTLADNTGCHIVGYFSKEKNSFLNYNVSCILTLPPYQRQGFGRLLIEFSYLLTRTEGKVGSPEKPLSDLGLISYRSYWKDAVLRRLCACASREMNVKDLSLELGVTSADLISTLQFLGMLKYWKGKHLVLKKQDVLEEYLERMRRRGEQRTIDSSCLRWRPYQSPPDSQN